MVTVKKLVLADTDKKLGNHRVEIQSNGEKWFYYYATAIAKVNFSNRTITINDGGWGTSSTTRAINSYLREYDGFKVIDLRK